MQAIDVVMLTKNSEHLLEKCVASIYRNVPVNNLIIVDGFSTDRTLEIVAQLKKKHPNVKVLQMNGSRARAREKGIRQVESDWFLFVDSDVVLSEGWYQKAQKEIRPDVGAIWGTNIDVIPNLRNKRILNAQVIISSQCFSLRGGTHDTLIRTDLVRGIKIPEQLHTYEDAYIMNHIKNQGYKAIVGNGIFCLHYKPPTNWSFSNAIEGGIQELKCGLVESHNFKYMAYYPVFALHWILQIALQNGKKLPST